MARLRSEAPTRLSGVCWALAVRRPRLDKKTNKRDSLMSTTDVAGRVADAERRSEIPFESLTWPQVIVVAVFVVVALWYLSWRPSTFNPNAMIFSWVVYCAEVFGFVMALLHLFMVWRLSVREPTPAPTGKTVDVFVTTYNEPVEMIRRTLLAATRIEYPHVTWLLDDGNRSEMRALAEELGAKYLARSDNADAKAGNLNNALKFAEGEFVAVFDADHAPAPNFLSRTLGYFDDEKVGFVSTPQDFYNLDSYQHRRSAEDDLVWNEQALFFRVIQRGKDYRNSSFFSGTCGVLRRSALNEVGGFSTATLTEDLDTSLHIHQRGWKSVYHAESLAFGVAPTDVVPFLKQRMRWGQGAMQVLRRHGLILFARGLTMSQRLSYLASILMYFDGWQKAIFYVAPAIVLITGIMPIKELNWDYLIRFVPYYVLTFWAFEEVSRGFGRSLNVERYNMARFAAFIWSTFGLVRGKMRFGVTAKERSSQAAAKANWRFMLPQRGVALLNLVAIPLGIFLYFQIGNLPMGALIANVFWAAVNASLAAVVLSFTRRVANFLRKEYRFKIPLPATLHFDEEPPIDGILDDVSADGFRYYGRFPITVRAGSKLSGEVSVPSGKLNFDAIVRVVRSAEDGEPRSIGCSFEWKTREAKDRMSVFLYGSDLQWKVNDLAERAPTPLERLQGWLGLQSEQDKATRPHWASTLFHPLSRPNAGMDVGIVTVPGPDSPDRTLVTFRPLGGVLPVHLEVSSRSGIQTLKGQATLRTTINSNGAPMYVHRFVAFEPTAKPALA